MTECVCTSCTCATVQSRWANEPVSTGVRAAAGASNHVDDSTCSVPGRLQWVAMGSWPSARTLTPNNPTRTIASRDRACRFNEIKIDGGSTDKEVTAVAVTPEGRSAASTYEITVTVAGNRRN